MSKSPRCQRVSGLNFSMCANPATKKITRRGQVRYYCDKCADIMVARAKERFRVEPINA